MMTKNEEIPLIMSRKPNVSDATRISTSKKQITELSITLNTVNELNITPNVTKAEYRNENK
jgi:hypothetical protein